MSENLPLDNENNTEETPQTDEIVVATKPHPVKRLGCGILLVAWFTLLMTPCMLFYLASNGEIRIWHSDIPEPDAHPRVLVELITEIDYRGLQLTRSFPVNASESAVCVQTDVSFFLWHSIEENLDSSYCDCYQRDEDNSDWLLNETTIGVCTVPSS